jgi:hypothetical protein
VQQRSQLSIALRVATGDEGSASMDDSMEPSPLDDAQARLSKLAVAGAAPARLTVEVGDLIAGWAAEPDMAGATAQARIERLWDGFTRDASELQEQISDADARETPALRLAQRQLAALQAIVAALQAAHEHLPGAEDASA